MSQSDAARRLRVDTHAKLVPMWQRLAWFVALWLLGVVTVGAVAMLLRWLLLGGG